MCACCADCGGQHTFCLVLKLHIVLRKHLASKYHSKKVLKHTHMVRCTSCARHGGCMLACGLGQTTGEITSIAIRTDRETWQYLLPSHRSSDPMHSFQSPENDHLPPSRAPSPESKESGPAVRWPPANNWSTFFFLCCRHTM